MKSSTKWIIGILVGLVVVVCLASLSIFAYNIWNPGAWEYGMRSGRLWDDQPLLPRQFMPMRPFSGVTGSWFGIFGFGRIFFGALLCLGVPVLIVLGVVLLVRNAQKSPQPLPSQPISAPPASSPTQAPAEPEPAAGACSSCGRQVQPDWSNCPYCGNTL